MRNIIPYNTYKKDFKLVKKQLSSEKWDINKIREAILHLQGSDILPKELLDHPLFGDYKDFREIHIYGDLCIVYQRNDKELHLRRIGRHQDIFRGY